MSRVRQARQAAPGDARITEAHDVAGRLDEGEIQPTDGRRRRWYHLRPRPRQRTDLLGFNSAWWMVLVWIVVIVLIIYPYPGW